MKIKTVSNIMLFTFMYLYILYQVLPALQSAIHYFTEESEVFIIPENDFEKYEMIVRAFQENEADGILSMVEIKDNEAGIRGIFSKADIPADTELMTVDLSQMIESMELSEMFDDLEKFAAEKKEMIMSSTLFATLRFAQHPEDIDPRWFLYFSILPTQFDELPVNFSEEKLKAFEGTNFYKKVKERRQLDREQYTILYEFLKDKQEISFEEFNLYISQWKTRSFAVDQIHGESAMIPALDMLNHNLNPNCRVRLHPDYEIAVLEAKRDIKQGEELTITYYDDLTDSYSLLVYGFIDLSLPITSISIDIEEYLMEPSQQHIKESERVKILEWEQKITKIIYSEIELLATPESFKQFQEVDQSLRAYKFSNNYDPTLYEYTSRIRFQEHLEQQIRERASELGILPSKLEAKEDFISVTESKNEL